MERILLFTRDSQLWKKGVFFGSKLQSLDDGGSVTNFFKGEEAFKLFKYTASSTQACIYFTF